MLERPEVTDAALAAGLRTHYGIGARDIEFLPIGYDSHAWVFRVEADDGSAYFLKLRRGPVHEASLAVPHFLMEHGITQVVAPLTTRAGGLWATADAFRIILYPFVEGVSGMEGGLTDDQWVEYGAILRRIHAVTPSPALVGQMRRETFVPHLQWSSIARTLHAQIGVRDYTDPHERELAAFWRGRHAEVDQIMAHTEALGQRLQQRTLDFVLCHADIHTANLLVGTDGTLHFVDWDETILAPKERDLMFIVGARVATVVEPRQEKLFFRGYGETEIDALALAYYRYEWVVQEIGAFGEQVFLTPGVGEMTKADAVQHWMALFAPGHEVDVAYGVARG